MNRLRPLLFVLAVAAIVVLSGCATQPDSSDAFEAAGFWRGYWHGLTIYFAFIGHFFDNTIRLYNFPNNGGWYDFGFLCGIATITGGSATAAKSSGD
jgi:hypothetical protein